MYLKIKWKGTEVLSEITRKVQDCEANAQEDQRVLDISTRL